MFSPKQRINGIMTLGESIDFDDKYTNAKISGLDKTAYFESHGNNNNKENGGIENGI